MELRGIILIAVLASAPRATPQEPHPLVAQSDCGGYALTLWPNLRDTGARMSLRREQEVLWDRSLPFEVEDAFVTSRGFVAGFLNEADGVSREGLCMRLRIVGFTPDGTQVLDSTSTGQSGYLCSVGMERILGIVASEEANAICAWTTMDRLLRLRLDDGAALEPLRMKAGLADPRIFAIKDLRPVPGTPWILVHSVLRDPKAPPLERFGARFDLVGADFRPAWTLALRGDCALDSESRTQSDFEVVWPYIRRETFIRIDGPRTFSLRSIAAGCWIRYGVEGQQESQAAAPEVREVARTQDPSPIRFPAGQGW